MSNITTDLAQFDFASKSHECALKLTDFWMTGLLFDLNCEFSTRASLLALAKSIHYRNDLKGNKNCFDMAGGSSYGEFELPRVK